MASCCLLTIEFIYPFSLKKKIVGHPPAGLIYRGREKRKTRAREGRRSKKKRKKKNTTEEERSKRESRFFGLKTFYLTFAKSSLPLLKLKVIFSSRRCSLLSNQLKTNNTTPPTFRLKKPIPEYPGSQNPRHNASHNSFSRLG